VFVQAFALCALQNGWWRRWLSPRVNGTDNDIPKASVESSKRDIILPTLCLALLYKQVSHSSIIV
jgi:hypothetical protein